MEALEIILYTLMGLWTVFVFATMYVISEKLRFWQRDFRPPLHHRILQLIARIWRKVWH